MFVLLDVTVPLGNVRVRCTHIMPCGAAIADDVIVQRVLSVHETYEAAIRARCASSETRGQR